MERDREVAVVTDSGTSMQSYSPEARKLGVTVVPLEIAFWENGKYVSYSDADINSSDFYERMRTSERLPQTSGAVSGRLTEAYKNLALQNKSILSIHITSKHSATYQSAILAKDIVQGERAVETPIEVIDSKQVSIATWFPVVTAEHSIQKGASLKQTLEEIEEVIKKTQLFVTLETFENLKKGGRGEDILKAVLATTLSLYPIISLVDGKLKNCAFARSVDKSRERMIEMVGDAGKLIRVAVVHTNAPGLAKTISEELTKRKIFSGIIPVYKAGPVLAVHAGEGAVGIAFQKA